MPVIYALISVVLRLHNTVYGYVYKHPLGWYPQTRSNGKATYICMRSFVYTIQINDVLLYVTHNSAQLILNTSTLQGLILV